MFDIIWANFGIMFLSEDFLFKIYIGTAII